MTGLKQMDQGLLLAGRRPNNSVCRRSVQGLLCDINRR